MADFVLKNSLFVFDSKYYRHISGAAIGAQFAPSYDCIFMNHIEMDAIYKTLVLEEIY